jgi:hypothetical protein
MKKLFALHKAYVPALLLIGVLVAGPAHAGRAGVVVDFGNGQVVTQCVKFQGPYITGFDLLQRSGLAFTFQNFSGLGAAICSIQSTGCQFPAQACFCQCPDANGNCNFFGYYVQDKHDTSFTFSDVGVSSQIVRNKDVNAFVFGSGTVPPTGYTFEDICKNNP